MATGKSDLVLKLKQEATALFDKGEKLAAVFNKISKGLFMYKKNLEDKFKVAYYCEKCGNSETTEMDLQVPYTVHCGKCDDLIFKQEKVKGKRGRKKKKK